MFTAQKVRAPIAGWLATPQCRTVEQYAQVTKTPYVFDHNARNFQSFFPIEVRFVAVDSLNEVNLPPFCCITCKLQGIGLILLPEHSISMALAGSSEGSLSGLN